MRLILYYYPETKKCAMGVEYDINHGPMRDLLYYNEITREDFKHILDTVIKEKNEDYFVNVKVDNKGNQEISIHPNFLNLKPALGKPQDLSKLPQI